VFLGWLHRITGVKPLELISMLKVKGEAGFYLGFNFRGQNQNRGQNQGSLPSPLPSLPGPSLPLRSRALKTS